MDSLHLIPTSSYEKVIASWSLRMADFPDDTENLLVRQSDVVRSSSVEKICYLILREG